MAESEDGARQPYGAIDHRSARPGDAVELFGTGLGPAPPSMASGIVFSGSSTSVNPITVTVGGTPTDYRGPATRASIMNVHMGPAPFSQQSVVDELEKILSIPSFASAARSSKLLRFVVEHTVAGQGDQLKDYTLGAQALGRSDSFDPRIDPIARVEFSRLRTRLEQYYAAEGRNDSLLIVLPKGTYVPLFEHRPIVADAGPSAAPVGRPSGAGAQQWKWFGLVWELLLPRPS